MFFHNRPINAQMLYINQSNVPINQSNVIYLYYIESLALMFIDGISIKSPPNPLRVYGIFTTFPTLAHLTVSS